MRLPRRAWISWRSTSSTPGRRTRAASRPSVWRTCDGRSRRIPTSCSYGRSSRASATASSTAATSAGLLGLPVFAGGTSGPARLAGPTGGYLAGFVLAAYVVGLLAELGWDRRIWTCVLAMLAGEVVIYAFGLAALSRFPLPNGVLEAGLLPFLIGYAYKVALAAIALPTAWHFVPGLRAPK